jgi:hypothetical protein
LKAIVSFIGLKPGGTCEYPMMEIKRSRIDIVFFMYILLLNTPLTPLKRGIVSLKKIECAICLFMLFLKMFKICFFNIPGSPLERG